MSRSRRLAVLIALAGLLLAAAPARAGDETCYPIEVTWYSPTGIAGCTVYGQGTASMWGGPGAARNDCVFPWDDCQTIAVRSLDTGLQIVVTPTMFGDLYTGTPRERIVDLDPSMVAALGLDPADGLWDVEVWPVDKHTGLLLPDTAAIAP